LWVFIVFSLSFGFTILLIIFHLPRISPFHDHQIGCQTHLYRNHEYLLEQLCPSHRPLWMGQLSGRVIKKNCVNFWRSCYQEYGIFKHTLRLLEWGWSN
jgi:hypothetical protein